MRCLVAARAQATGLDAEACAADEARQLHMLLARSRAPGGRAEGQGRAVLCRPGCWAGRGPLAEKKSNVGGRVGVEAARAPSTTLRGHACSVCEVVSWNQSGRLK